MHKLPGLPSGTIDNCPTFRYNSCALLSQFQDRRETEAPLRLSEFGYDLPPDRIAQTPLPARDQSRLLVVNRERQSLADSIFRNIPDLLAPEDVLVLNDTRVSAIRLFGARQGCAAERVETFLTHRIADGLWAALVKPGRKLLPGVIVDYGDGLTGEVLERTDDRGGRLIRFRSTSARRIDDILTERGSVPLPPYITTPLPNEERNRYQTVYALTDGSAAAPTAGLHFTSELLAKIRAKGVQIAWVTLHVGLGTFRPISTDDISAHVMHAERISVPAETAQAVNDAAGRVVAVGTTSVRALESAAVGPGEIAPMSGDTNLYITPGYRFQIVDALITNFHMPRTTLLVMVSAFAGRDLIRRAYAEAIAAKYRFLSFGDAMFIC